MLEGVHLQRHPGRRGRRRRERPAHLRDNCPPRCRQERRPRRRSPSPTTTRRRGRLALALTPATINESGTGNAEHGYGEHTVGVQRGHDGHGVGEPGGHPTTLTGNTTPEHPGGATRTATGVVTITAGERRRGDREPDGGGERDGGERAMGVTDPDDVTLTIREDDAAGGKVTLALTPATINESGAGNASTVTASVPSAIQRGH